MKSNLKIILTVAGLVFLVGINSILIIPTIYSIFYEDESWKTANIYQLEQRDLAFQILLFHPSIIFFIIILWAIKKTNTKNPMVNQ